jgi:hypothetical protein
VQDLIPLRIHRQDQVVSGEAWRSYKEAHPRCKFSNFGLECCQYFLLRSFQLVGFSFNGTIMLLPAKLQVHVLS